MKQVIYKQDNLYCVTNAENYNSYIRNERQVLKMPGFFSAQDVISYFIKYGWAKSPDDFIIKS